MSNQELITKRFNVHNLVRVKVQTCSMEVIAQTMHQLSEFSTDEDNDVVPDVLIVDYERLPKFDKPLVISEYYIYADGWLNIPSRKVCFNLVTNPITMYCRRLALPINFLVHLVLLKQGKSLIHAAGIELKGKRYLFPAFGGIGKTILVAAALLSGGRFFGDDMVIIDENYIYSYPIDFSVYHYHMKILGIKNRKAKLTFLLTDFLDMLTGPLERFNWLAVRFLRLLLNTLKEPCINVPPRDIFGSQSIVGKGSLDQIFFLQRRDGQLRTVEVADIDSETVASCATDILFHEWHQSAQFLLAYSALSSFSFMDVCLQTRAIFKLAFTEKKCCLIEIPQSISTDDYQRELLRIITN